MKTYLLRVGRYLVKMIVIIGIVLALLVWVGLSASSGEILLRELFLSNKGLLLLIVLLLFAFASPKFAYLRAGVPVDMEREREAIVNGLASIGYSLRSETDEAMVFRADSTLKRIMAVGDDAVTVTRERNGIALEGIRKQVARADYRIRMYSGR